MYIQKWPCTLHNTWSLKDWHTCRFDFNDDLVEGGPGAYSAPPSATFPPHTHRTVFLSPPASPSKKNRDCRSGGGGGGGAMGGAEGGGGSRARRPMNGFMLFAKHHRLKLIQQYPGKDNRWEAIFFSIFFFFSFPPYFLSFTLLEIILICLYKITRESLFQFKLIFLFNPKFWYYLKFHLKSLTLERGFSPQN